MYDIVDQSTDFISCMYYLVAQQDFVGQKADQYRSIIYYFNLFLHTSISMSERF